MVEHGKVRYLATLALQLVSLAPSEGSRSAAKVLEMDTASVVGALHSTQVCYFLGAKPPGLDLLLGYQWAQPAPHKHVASAVQATPDPKGFFFLVPIN